MGSKISLSELTHRFMVILKNSEGNEVDLSEIESQLQVSKRRIYDVTNVLSGIGAIVRCGKSRVKWVGYDNYQENENENESDHGIGIFSQEMKEKEIDRLTREVDRELSALYNSRDFCSFAWFSPENVLSVCDDSLTVFCLHGAPDMSIEVSEDEKDLFKIVCTSESGLIDFSPISK